MAETRPSGPEADRSHPYLTLDTVGLTEAQREHCAMFLGGSEARFVTTGEGYEYGEVDILVFRWGDERATDLFAALYEHHAPGEQEFPFSPSTVIGNQLWSLALQLPDFDPKRNFPSP